MKKSNKILFTLVLSLLIFPSYGYISQDKSINFSTIDINLLCNEWKLVKITIISEKVIYKDEGKTTLNINCDQNSWEIKEETKLVSSGTWKLDDSKLELRTKNGTRLFNITYLSKNKLIIAYADVIQEYVRR